MNTEIETEIARRVEAAVKSALGDMHRDMKAMHDDMVDLRQSVDGLVKAWSAAGTLVTAVKYAAGFVAACGIIWATVRYSVTGEAPK